MDWCEVPEASIEIQPGKDGRRHKLWCVHVADVRETPVLYFPVARVYARTAQGAFEKFKRTPEYQPLKDCTFRTEEVAEDDCYLT